MALHSIGHVTTPVSLTPPGDACDEVRCLNVDTLTETLVSASNQCGYLVTKGERSHMYTPRVWSWWRWHWAAYMQSHVSIVQRSVVSTIQRSVGVVSLHKRTDCCPHLNEGFLVRWQWQITCLQGRNCENSSTMCWWYLKFGRSGNQDDFQQAEKKQDGRGGQRVAL